MDWVCSFVCVFRFLGKKYGWSKKLTGCLILTGLKYVVPCFPIIEALYGQEGMKTAILVDQPELCSTFLRDLVATMYLKGRMAFKF
jgi:hypothetical protein